MSDRLNEQLRRHEGVKRHVYQDHLGFWTIGVGRLVDERGGLGLSEDEIDLLLKNDIERSQRELSENFIWFKDLNEARKDAFTNLHFNLGLPRLLSFKKTIQHMENGDYILASEELLDSKYARQLENRSAEVAEMIATGEYP